MIEIPLSTWEQAFGLSVNVWLRAKRLQGIFHVENIRVQDKEKTWHGRVVGVPILSVILKGKMEWVNPYVSKSIRKHKTRRKTYKPGALTPGFICTDWPCRDYANLESYRGGDILKELVVTASEFIPESMAATSAVMGIYEDDEPLPLDFVERVTWWDGEKWRLRE